MSFRTYWLNTVWSLACAAVNCLEGFCHHAKLLPSSNTYLASKMYWATKVSSKSTINIEQSLIGIFSVSQLLRPFTANVPLPKGNLSGLDMASKLEYVMILSGFSPSAGATQMISLEISGFSTYMLATTDLPSMLITFYCGII